MLTRADATSVVQEIEQAYRSRTPGSAALFGSANGLIPGGASRSLVFYEPYPVAMGHGSGARFVDVDGNEYLDFVNCHSALVHGHAHPGITTAIQRQAARGVAWSSASREEFELASLLRQRLPSAEMVRFCCSGTEAAMYAVRLARASTGRPKVLKFEGGYHGSYDDAEVSKTISVDSAGPPDDPRPVLTTGGFPSGTTERVLVAPFNNVEVVRRRFQEHPGEIAAVIVEPVLGAGGMVPPEPEFLRSVQEVAQRHGALLIADEVVSFRLAPGGAQRVYGIQPDLTLLGKLIGGGLPVAAIAGRRDVLSLSSKLSLSGTFSGGAVGMVAGAASLEALTAEAIERINRLGESLRVGLRRVLDEVGLRAQVTGVGSLLQLHFTAEPVRDHRTVVTSHRALLGPLHLWLLNHGVAMYARGAFNISTAMDEADIRAAVDATRSGLNALRPVIEATAPELIAE